MNKKNDQPYMPFYIGDWKKAPEIKALSLAARGLWVEMLFLMWESTERGYLTINGVPMTIDILARQVGFACDLLEPLLEEMKKFAVYSVRDDGAIYSRKMVKDAEISLKRSYAGQKGGICSSKNSSKHSSKTQANTDIDIDNENDIENESLKDEEVQGKKKKKTVFVPPTKIEVHEYFFDNGFTGLSADRFFEGYAAADWHDSQGKQIRNWKQKAQQVWFKEENKIDYKKEPTNKYGRQEVTMEQLRQQAERIPLCEKSILDQISDTCKPISEQ